MQLLFHLALVAKGLCAISLVTEPMYTLNVALYEAVGNQRVGVAALLIDNGADFNAILTEPMCHYSSWKFAFSPGWIYTIPSLRMVRLLLERGADANMVDAGGWSPLRESLRQCIISDVAKLLLEYGADPNLIHAYTGETPLMRAVLNKRLDLVRVLLDHGADPNLAHTTTGQTVLMKAVVEPSVDIIKVLLEYGADVTQVNREGKSVLDMLGAEKYSEVVALCTEYIECNQPGVRPLLK